METIINGRAYAMARCFSMSEYSTQRDSVAYGLKTFRHDFKREVDLLNCAVGIKS